MCVCVDGHTGRFVGAKTLVRTSGGKGGGRGGGGSFAHGGSSSLGASVPALGTSRYLTLVNCVPQGS